MERTDGRSGLRLNRPRREVLRELEKKVPVAPPPAEQRHAAASVGVIEVVLALRDRRQQAGPLAANLQVFFQWRAGVPVRGPGRGVKRNRAEGQRPLRLVFEESVLGVQGRGAAGAGKGERCAG